MFSRWWRSRSCSSRNRPVSDYHRRGFGLRIEDIIHALDQDTTYGRFRFGNADNGAFTLGRSDLDALLRYIDTQEQHHLKIDVKDELRSILQRYGVAGDERYLWD